MSNGQDNTAIVAIVIALIALFVTSAHLSQSFFRTAQGYRQCQSSVIGDWAKRTKCVWRWSEFRFETIFTTPDISLIPYSQIYSRTTERSAYLDGSRASQIDTYCNGDPGDGLPQGDWVNTVTSERADDLVSWLGLLKMLHRLHFHYSLAKLPEPSQTGEWSGSGAMTCPAITYRTRSWDFMPPDILRPFATSNVGDIIVLALRLGMRWKDIRPDDGIMRAEGNGQSITSTAVRGFGLLLQYNYDWGVASKHDRDGDHLDSMTINSGPADKLSFQIVPGHKSLRLPDFVFGNRINGSVITRVMSQLGIDREVQDMYVDQFHKSKRLYGLSDLVGMVAPFLPFDGSPVVQVFSPYPEAYDSPTNLGEGFAVYLARLLKYLDVQRDNGDHSKQMEWVLEKFEYMESTYLWGECHSWEAESGDDETQNGAYPWDQFPSWEAESASKEPKNGRPRMFLKDLHDIWSTTTEYFNFLRLRSRQQFRYIDLVGAHIAQAVYYPTLAEANIKAGGYRRYELGAGRSKRVAEGMHIYVDQIPKVVQFMREKGFNDEKVVREAWWTLMLRAMCWHRSVALTEYQSSHAVSPSFYQSRSPVYIA